MPLGPHIFLNSSPICVQLNFCLNLVFGLAPYFDHVAFTHHALHVYWTPWIS